MSYILIPVVLNQIYSNPYKVVFISTGPHNRKEGVPNLCMLLIQTVFVMQVNVKIKRGTRWISKQAELHW